MTTFTQLPGVLNLDFVRGDSLSIDVDFDQTLNNYTLAASLISIVTGEEVAPLTATLTSGASGIVTISLTDEQTAAIQRGTYRWELTWTSPAGEVRKALSGFAEVR